MIFFKNKFSKFIPIIFLIIVSITFFYKFFFHHLVAIPTDITVGMYYPWLDYKWGGFTTNVPVKNPLMSDIVSIIYQWKTLSIESLKQGQFPFWTDKYLLGVPLFANFQNSLINLTNIPFFLTSNNSLAWTWMLFFQLLFSLFSSYFCLRVFKFKKISSIIGSLTFSISLFSIVWLEYGIHTYVAAFLPLLFVCVEKYSQSHKVKYLVFLSLLVALQFYGGYPQYSIFSLVIISLYYIFFVKQEKISKYGKYFIFISLGLLLCAPLLIPGYELTNRSIRDIDTTAQDQTLGFLPLRNLLTLPIPNFWGSPSTYDYSGIGFYDNNAIFPGTLALISFFFVLYLFFKKKINPKIIFFEIIIIFSIIISVQNPISIFLKNHLGIIFSGNGVSTRIFLLANFSFSFITAFVIDNLKKIKTKFNLFLCIPTIWQLTILVLSHFKVINLSPVAFKNCLYSLIISGGILFMVLLYQKNKSKFFQNILLIGLVFCVIFELFYYALKYLPFSKSEYLFPITPEIEYLQKNSSNYRISTSTTIPANMWAPYGLSSPDGYDTTMPLLNFEYYSLLQNGDFSSTAKRAISMDNEKSNLYQNLSIKYKLTLGDSKTTNSSKSKDAFSTVFHQKNTAIQENQEVLSKIRFIENIVFVKDKYEFKDTYSELDFSKTAVVYNEDQDNFKDLLSENSCITTEESIQVIEDSDSIKKFITTNNCSSLVFISNSFYPGWQATIDGQVTKIYQTNHLFQSIIVPSGTHQIELNYIPTNFKTAIYLLISSGIILIGVLLYDLKKK